MPATATRTPAPTALELVLAESPFAAHAIASAVLARHPELASDLIGALPAEFVESVAAEILERRQARAQAEQQIPAEPREIETEAACWLREEAPDDLEALIEAGIALAWERHAASPEGATSPGGFLAAALATDGSIWGFAAAPARPTIKALRGRLLAGVIRGFDGLACGEFVVAGHEPPKTAETVADAIESLAFGGETVLEIRTHGLHAVNTDG